jgi:hypothetical protein
MTEQDVVNTLKIFRHSYGKTPSQLPPPLTGASRGDRLVDTACGPTARCRIERGNYRGMAGIELGPELT